MAKSILVTGIAGSGKSSVCKELLRRGYRAFSIEDMKGLFVWIDKETGEIVKYHNNDDLESVKQCDWICNINKLKGLMRKNAEGTVYYCGTASNIDEIAPLFDKVILLKTKPETIRKRLAKRKSQDFGNTTEVQEWVLSWKDWWENHMQEKGAIVVNADQNLPDIVADIIEKSKI